VKFVSYAQNFEDVMLWRALKDVHEGFYVDLGAWSPDRDSVTRAFYERGWRGLNVEPNPVLHAQLQDKRPRDINLRVAVGARPGKAMMNFVENSGLSTLLDSVAERHQAAGWHMAKQEVDVVTLEDVFRTHIPEHQSVHFLKIDVEGMEGEVIRGFPWMRLRPWVLVIEATEPMSQTATHQNWAASLTSAGYEEAYWDGLNRFYIAQEHARLRTKFSAPPNVFDDFELADAAEPDERRKELEARIERLSSRLTDSTKLSNERHQEIGRLQRELKALDGGMAAALARVQSLEASLSWRVTAPLRLLWSGCLAVQLRVVLALRGLVVRGLRHQKLVSAVHAVLAIVPPLHRWTMRRVDVLVQGKARHFGFVPPRQRDSLDCIAPPQRPHGPKAYRLLGGVPRDTVTVDEALARLRAELQDQRTGR
jgi:FkbM family methyltransferase